MTYRNNATIDELRREVEEFRADVQVYRQQCIEYRTLHKLPLPPATAKVSRWRLPLFIVAWSAATSLVTLSIYDALMAPELEPTPPAAKECRPEPYVKPGWKGDRWCNPDQELVYLEGQGSTCVCK